MGVTYDTKSEHSSRCDQAFADYVALYGHPGAVTGNTRFQRKDRYEAHRGASRSNNRPARHTHGGHGQHEWFRTRRLRPHRVVDRALCVPLRVPPSAPPFLQVLLVVAGRPGIQGRNLRPRAADPATATAVPG